MRCTPSVVQRMAVLMPLLGFVGFQEDPYARFIARTDPLSPAEQQKKFHLPPGFEIQLVAAEPAVQKPINLCFDAHGRLLVTGSVEYPRAPASAAVWRDRIQVLEDGDRDGRFERVGTLAGGLHLPVGIAAVSPGVLAYSMATIDRFRGSGGDGRADRRDVLYRGFGSDDTHGMPNGFVWWIDGWVYACHGEGNTSTVSGSDGAAVTLRGGNTFRMRPDGARIELFSHGQVNPFGLCFDPLGNAYSADSHSRPATLLLRGAWYPGLGGTGHDGLGFAPELMQHQHGSTGIAGIACYAADQFPLEYRDTLFIGNPVTGRINHDRLEAHGSTYRAVELPDFLTCDDPWFRPVDVRLGPDGALYIADFYNRIIGHTEVPLSHVERDRARGRIWRVVYRGKDATTSARGCPNLADARLEPLLDALAHPNLSVRVLATHELAERIGRDAVEPVRRLVTCHSHRWQRAHGLWVLQRLNALDEPTIRRLADDPERDVRVHLVRAVAETGWDRASDFRHALVRDKLNDPDSFVRRAAAEAQARHPSKSNIDPLLALWAGTPPDDTLLVHTVRMTLRDHLRALGDVAALAAPYADRPADQRRLADVCLGVPTAGAAKYVFSLLQRNAIEPARFGEFLQFVATWLDEPDHGALHAYALRLQKADESTQRVVLRAFHRAAQRRGDELPVELRTWGVALARSLLAHPDERPVYTGIELTWDLELAELVGELAGLAGRNSPHPELRPFAMDALGAIDESRALPLVDAWLGDPAESLDIREKAADTLGKMHAARHIPGLLRHLPTAPLSLARVIAQHLAHTRGGGELLLATIAEGKASPALIMDAVVDLRLRDAALPDIDRRLAKLREGLPPEDERLSQLLAAERERFLEAKPDVARGRAVFEKHCAVCHQVGGAGNPVGPALDGAGRRGLDRLLEDILDPNRNVAQSYRSSIVALKNGRVLSGLVMHEDPQRLRLADSAGKTAELAVAEIAERRFSALSPMPANARDKIAESDFRDLLGYLLTVVR